MFYRQLFFRRCLVCVLLTEVSTLRRQSLGRSSIFTLPSARRACLNVLRNFPEPKTDCIFLTTKSSTYPAVAACLKTVNTAASRSSPFGIKIRRTVRTLTKVTWFGVACSDSISSLYVLIAMRRASRFSCTSFSQVAHL